MKNELLFHVSKKSQNKKTGPITVTTSAKETCPNACPLKNTACYAESGPLSWHWNAVTNSKRGGTWDQFLTFVKTIPNGAIWRHNQAGDLVGSEDKIDAAALSELVAAAKGSRGFTYTHYPITDPDNLKAVTKANKDGFTVNVSADTVKEAQDAFKRGLPTCLVLPEDYPKRGTIGGVPYKVCPAQVLPGKTCANCRLCAASNRKYAIGFYVHGNKKQNFEFKEV